MTQQMTTTNGNQGGGALEQRPPRGDARIENVKQLFAQMAPKLTKVLPKHLTAERLVQVSVACITRVPKLLEATPASLMHAVMQCAELGLEPASSLGEAYLVPFNRNVAAKGAPPQFITEVVFIPGYRGLVSLARRSGAVTDVESQLVREGDFFRYERGIDLILRHKPRPGPTYQRKIVAAYMVAHLRGTKRPHVEVMWFDEIEAIRMRSQTGKNGGGPWGSDYGEMARKTVVRRGVKMLPMSVAMLQTDEGKRFEKALAADEDDFEPEGTVTLEHHMLETPGGGTPSGIGTSPNEPAKGLKGKARARAAEGRAAPPVIEDSFLPAEEPAGEPELAAAEPPPPPPPRALTYEEREAEQAEIALAAADAKRRADEKLAAERAARAEFMRVPGPKKAAAPPPAEPDEVKLADFKLTAPAAGAAPVERVAGEDDDS